MREIKFRAFSKKVQGMVFVEHATFLKDDSLVVYDDYELMQYTGLKDKNGVEIYEGDILVADKKDSKGRDWIGVVEPNVYGGLCLYYFEYRNMLDKQIASCIQEPQTAEWVSQNCEAIGNIYENPELLESK